MHLNWIYIWMAQIFFWNLSCFWNKYMVQNTWIHVLQVNFKSEPFYCLVNIWNIWYKCEKFKFTTKLINVESRLQPFTKSSFEICKIWYTVTIQMGESTLCHIETLKTYLGVYLDLMIKINIFSAHHEYRQGRTTNKHCMDTSAVTNNIILHF